MTTEPTIPTLPPEPTYTVTLTRTQLRTVSIACELLARVNLGQLGHVEECISSLPISERLALREKLTDLNPLVTGLDNKHASRCRDEHQRLDHEIAWGIYWGTRYPLYLDGCAERGEKPSSITVYNDPPQPCGGQPVPKVERVP